MNKLTHTPDGLSDLLASEYEQKCKIESTALAVFSAHGYKTVQAPMFEFCDIYDAASTLSNEQMFKFFDKDGRTLALRPDITTSIARMAATKLVEDTTQLPLKLSYIGSAFRNDEAFSRARQREFTQTGIELLGDSSASSDAEVIEIAIKTLSAAGLKKFRIDMGQIGFFNGIAEQADFSAADRAKLQRIIDCKDLVELNKFLEPCNISTELKEIISQIPSMFGGIEVAKLLINNPVINSASRLALENLCEVYDILAKRGYAEYLSIDLGMVPNLDYYTGIIIKGFTYKVGFPLVSGGRYDNLTAKFGKPMLATGISIGVERVMTALTKCLQETTDDEYVTIALAKGRLSEFAMELFEKAGYDVSEMKEKSRKLIFEDTKHKLKFILVKASDVPTYVEYGAADIGIVGKDTILEEGKRIYEVLDLGFGRCKMSVAAMKTSKQKLCGRNIMRVATKYPAIAKEYFHCEKGQTVDIIKLNGSVELGPLIGLSDVIVDIVESGKTLVENGLEVVEDICELSARMVVNRVSMKMKREKVLDIKERVNEVNK